VGNFPPPYVGPALPQEQVPVSATPVSTPPSRPGPFRIQCWRSRPIIVVAGANYNARRPSVVQSFAAICCAQRVHAPGAAPKTDARPILSAVAMSAGRMPCAFNSRTRAASIEGRPALVGASGLRLGDALKLALAPQVRLGKHAEHVEEALAGGSACVDRLLGRLEGGAAGADCSNDVLKIADAPGQPVDARHHEHVALAEEFENRAQLVAALRGSLSQPAARSAVSWIERS
jgi:hypothetical protein